jgi:hypothetical protein
VARRTKSKQHKLLEVAVQLEEMAGRMRKWTTWYSWALKLSLIAALIWWAATSKGSHHGEQDHTNNNGAGNQGANQQAGNQPNVLLSPPPICSMFCGKSMSLESGEESG